MYCDRERISQQTYVTVWKVGGKVNENRNLPWIQYSKTLVRMLEKEIRE